MKLAILGLDGLFPAFLDTFAEQLPNLHRLRREGTSATLRSVIPPYTPQAWTTMLTGVNPGAHGIAGFTIREEGRECLENRTSILVRQLGDYLQEQGVRCAMLNVPLTYPAPRSATGPQGAEVMWIANLGLAWHGEGYPYPVS